MEGSAFSPAFTSSAHSESDWGQDVGLFAIGVLEKRDAGRAVRIIFDGEDFRVDSLLLAFEIDEAVFSFVAAAAMSHGQAPVVVSATGPLAHGRERLFRLVLGDLGKAWQRLESARRSKRSEILESHNT